MKRKLLALAVAAAMTLSTAGIAFAGETPSADMAAQIVTDSSAAEAVAGAETADTSLQDALANGAQAEFAKASPAAAGVGETVKAQETTLSLTDVKANGFTLSWPLPDITNKTFKRYEIWEGDEVLVSIENYSYNKVVFYDLKRGLKTYLTVKYVYASGSYEYTNTIGYMYVNTLPKAIYKSKIELGYIGDTSTTIAFTGKLDNATGIQFQLRKYNGNLVASKKGYSSASFNTGTKTAYKFRARSYFENYSNGKTYFGPWTGYKYFALPKVTGKVYYSSNKVKVTVKKMKGVKKYKIYVSKKENSGYKYSKSIKMKSGKSTYTTSIYRYGDKRLKDGNKYYFKVVPVLKNGKKSQSWRILWTYL